MRMVGRVLLGAGMLLLEPFRLARFESLRPRGTSQFGPPLWEDQPMNIRGEEKSRDRGRERKGLRLTRRVESRAARARMSAQETVAGHSLSRAALMASTTSKPLTELRFGLESFSLTMLPLLSNRIDPSHP